MNNILKNRNALVIVFEIIVIVLGVIGITFATSRLLNDRTQTELIIGEYNVDYLGDKEIIANNLEPISDSLININTKENVVRLEFSLRGVSTNNDEEDLIYDIMLSEMNIDCSLLSKYTKWNLYKNGNLISSGSLSPQFDGNVLGDTMRLTNIQEDLPTHKDEYDKYILIFWISESCEDLETCELIDQSNIIDSQMSMKVFIALYGGAKKEFKRVPNNETSCVREPNLYDNMIPIGYKDGKFVVVNKNNSDKDNLWYDYGNQKWANAVIVNDKNKYSQVGTIINNEDVLAYYVWIPKFSYKLWNIAGEDNNSYNAYDNGIEITFDTKNSNTPEYINGMYILHPAFNNTNGFWINKYEISKKDNIYVSLPETLSHINDTLENYKNIMNNLSIDYKLGDKVESRMVNNLEWGAALYLSHSKYGVCVNNGCDSISINTTQTSGNNKQDTITRNVYGVYDMAGLSSEYVLGNYDIGSATTEIKLQDGSFWGQSHSTISTRDYLLRGGINNGIFYFGDIGMGNDKISSRSVLISK